MSRDELVGLLAKYKYQSSLESTMTGKTWGEVSDYGRAAFIAQAQEFCPEVVAFVAGWLEDICDAGLYAKDDIPGVWRYTMTPDERDIEETSG